MTIIRLMASLKIGSENPSNTFTDDTISLSLHTPMKTILVHLLPPPKKVIHPPKRKTLRNPILLLLGPYQMRTCIPSVIEQRYIFEAFNSILIISRSIINLSQLKDSYCAVSTFLKAHKLYLFLCVCGNELYQDVFHFLCKSLCLLWWWGRKPLLWGVKLLWMSGYSKMWLVLCSLYSLYRWGMPDDFEVSLKGVKTTVVKPISDLSNFCPLSCVLIIAFLLKLSLWHLFPGNDPSIISQLRMYLFLIVCLKGTKLIGPCGLNSICWKVLRIRMVSQVYLMAYLSPKLW